jgi:SAM-dependent methyltransferase
MKTKTEKWYVDFFRDGFYYYHWNLGPEERAARAASEVDFVLSALGLPEGASILDLACGEGRHSVELARRGYRVTGLDLTPLHIRLAKRAARDAGVPVSWLRADMRDIPWQGEFDAIINLFTSFGFLESDAEDEKVLHAVAQALKPGGLFLQDVVNREMIVRHLQPRGWEEAPDGTLRLEHRRIDFMNGRQHNRVLIVHPDGTPREKLIDLRMYTLNELAAMHGRAGLELLQTWGGFDGREYGMDTRRMIVLAKKPG